MKKKVLKNKSDHGLLSQVNYNFKSVIIFAEYKYKVKIFKMDKRFDPHSENRNIPIKAHASNSGNE